MTVPWDYCDPTNYISTASGRLDRGMDSGLRKELPDVTSRTVWRVKKLNLTWNLNFQCNHVNSFRRTVISSWDCEEAVCTLSCDTSGSFMAYLFRWIRRRKETSRKIACSRQLICVSTMTAQKIVRTVTHALPFPGESVCFHCLFFRRSNHINRQNNIS